MDESTILSLSSPMREIPDWMRRGNELQRYHEGSDARWQPSEACIGFGVIADNTASTNLTGTKEVDGNRIGCR